MDGKVSDKRKRKDLRYKEKQWLLIEKKITYFLTWVIILSLTSLFGYTLVTPTSSAVQAITASAILIGILQSSSLRIFPKREFEKSISIRSLIWRYLDRKTTRSLIEYGASDLSIETDKRNV